MHDVIVIPTYNERQNIESLIREIFTVVPTVSIYVVDDSSPDGTGDIVRALKVRFPRLFLLSRPKKEGLGKAYLGAFQHILALPSQVRTLTMMDADHSHSPSYLKEMYDEISRYDFIVGSRYTPGGLTSGWELWRRLLSGWGNMYARTITRVPVRDFTGGFNMISAPLLRKLDLTKMSSSGYAFQMELKFLLFKVGARFKEVPIIFKNRTGGESKLSGHIVSEGVLTPWKIRLKQ